eukprot:TRINITY_DN67832_c4_g1_i2.p1 TRINITY_DN67832_c4_g1~~TRINITY_DN67832_c4_g1_i2.p1  ORF type:complete len:308 (-),score=40.13 TRINITY_DN67832_c4_g1_i2:116-1039(-)
MENTPHSSYTAVEDAFQCVVQTLADLQDSVQRKWDDFKKKRTDLEAKMNDYNLAVNGHKRVSLCVGGMNFDTTEETLLKEKETFFWAMLRSGQWHPDDKDGRYFINRSPQKFSAILDYLRDGEVWNWSKFSTDETNKLREEFDFYQVPFPEVKPTLCWTPTKAPNINIDNTNAIVSISTTADVDRHIYSTAFPTNVERVTFLVRTTRLKGAGSIYFGKCGVTLHAGDYSKNNGNDWEEDWLPKLEFPGGLVVHEFRFEVSLCGNSSAVTVTWPTGDTKTLQLPVQPAELQLCIGKTANCGLFELRQL